MGMGALATGLAALAIGGIDAMMSGNQISRNNATSQAANSQQQQLFANQMQQNTAAMGDMQNSLASNQSQSAAANAAAVGSMPGGASAGYAGQLPDNMGLGTIATSVRGILTNPNSARRSLLGNAGNG